VAQIEKIEEERKKKLEEKRRKKLGKHEEEKGEKHQKDESLSFKEAREKKIKEKIEKACKAVENSARPRSKRKEKSAEKEQGSPSPEVKPLSLEHQDVKINLLRHTEDKSSTDSSPMQNTMKSSFKLHPVESSDALPL